MPGRREKTRCFGDVSILNFADAAEPVGRATKRISDQRSFMCRMATEELQRDDAEEIQEAGDDGEEVETVGGAAWRVRKRRPAAGAPVGGSETYPALLWQLLGGYIHPETVGSFAAICRDAHRVTRTRAFWRRLYLRWAWGSTASDDEAAPHELCRSAVLGCHQRVRPRVIRALHRWHFAPAAAASVPPPPPPTGLHFLRFAVRGRRLFVLFRRGPPPPPPKPAPDTWEEAEAAAAAADSGDDPPCPTEGQWLLVAELDAAGCPLHCLEELLALDGRYVLSGLRCCIAVGLGAQKSGEGGGGASGGGASGGGASAGGASGGGRWFELVLRAPHGESRSIGAGCASAPQLLPWWRPGFLPALHG